MQRKSELQIEEQYSQDTRIYGGQMNQQLFLNTLKCAYNKTQIENIR